MTESAGRELADAQAALRRGAWQDARAGFDAVLAVGPSAPAWEGRSWATWWLEEVPACLAAREQAYRAYLAAEDQRGAARMALWLGDDQIEFRGAEAVAAGWFRRAARLLAVLDPAPEHGWLAVFEAHAALDRHDSTEARRLATQARELGRQHRAVDLEMFGLATEGLALVDRGAVADGMSCLDEAATAALAGEYENLAPAAWTCCRLISACELVRDYDRGAQWCAEVAAFSRRMDARFVTGVCRAHYAAILIWRGEWRQAEWELQSAIGDLAANRPSWLPEAELRLAELRRRQGRAAEAEALLRRHGEHPAALRGLAELSLDRDDPATARDLLERQLRRFPAASLLARAGVLELLVRAALRLGEPAAAAGHLAELRAVSETVATRPLQAAALLATGLVAAARGAPEQACDHFEDAVDLFARERAPMERELARLELARTLLALGRTAGAAEEAATAERELRRLGAGAAADQAAALTRRARDRPAAAGALLTSRQLQVLRLVAEGLGDREIASRLRLSEHTVHRHVANIFSRLGCSSRATAVAQAGRLGLL